MGHHQNNAGIPMKIKMAGWLALCGGLYCYSIAWAETPREASTDLESAWVGKTVDARGIGVTIVFDTAQAPDLKEWGAKAGKICVEWYPKIDKLLASEGFSPPKSVEIRFRKDFSGLAATTGNTITIQPDWVRKHPDDFGMVVHELTHVVQQYPQRGQKPGWLVEGIADYVRIAKFEPKAPRPRLNPDKAKYTDAYKTTAMFLEWAEKQHHAELVKKLNAALRVGTYSDAIWKDTTGSTLDDLWSDFADTLRKKA
jgi:hypothetical protein